MSKRSLHSLLLILAASGPALAQAPDGYIVTAESWTPYPCGTGLALVNPKTRIVDRIVGYPPSRCLGGLPMVALDDAHSLIYTRTVGPFGWIGEYGISGNRVIGAGFTGGRPPAGLVKRMHVFGPAKLLLFTINTVNSGLWSRRIKRFGPSPANKQEAKITDAWDVTTLGNMVYVSTYKPGTPSKIFAIDILKARPAVELKLNLGNLKIAPFQAMDADPFLNILVIGDDNGDLFWIHPTKLTVTKRNSAKGRGAVIALATADLRALAYVTDGKAVYDATSWSLPSAQPVYSSGQETINDVAYSRWTKGAFIHFGQPCGGRTGTPRILPDAHPTRGSNLRLVMQYGQPNAKALLFLGLSRQKWGNNALPMSLKFMGASGCNLYVSPDVVLPLITDGRGEVRFGGVVPSNKSFVGIHVMAQFALNHSGANAANTTVTDAVELVIR